MRNWDGPSPTTGTVIQVHEIDPITGEVSSYLSCNLIVQLESFDKAALDRKRADWALKQKLAPTEAALANKPGTPERPKDKADQDRAENEGMKPAPEKKRE